MFLMTISVYYNYTQNKDFITKLAIIFNLKKLTL
jgi:hypothetical protein